MPSPPSSSDAPAPSSTKDSTTTLPESPPPRPIPSSDKGFARLLVATPDADFPSPQLDAFPDDIFKITPLAALKLLGAGVEALVRMTGDIPPTPPTSTTYVPHMRGMQAEKESIVRVHSEKSLARLREQSAAGSKAFPGLGSNSSNPTPLSTSTTQAIISEQPQEIDGVRLRSPTPTTTLLTPSSTPEPYIIIGADSQPLNLQHSAITRKFYSKKPPPIGIGDYLLRIHRFCPMSTAVYLATSLYIHRLAVIERTIAVTRRNVHRLLLAGLRVAMKALEDLSYPHSKVAKVGGVSDTELARLEINFCFLAGFELIVREEEMSRHWAEMKSGKGIGNLDGSSDSGGGLVLRDVPRLRLERRPKGNVV